MNITYTHHTHTYDRAIQYILTESSWHQQCREIVYCELECGNSELYSYSLQGGPKNLDSVESW